jgi:hypothetical protein
MQIEATLADGREGRRFFLLVVLGFFCFSFAALKLKTGALTQQFDGIFHVGRQQEIRHWHYFTHGKIFFFHVILAPGAKISL